MKNKFNYFDTYIVGMIGKIFKIILTSFLLGDYLYTQHNTVQIFCAFFCAKYSLLYTHSFLGTFVCKKKETE